MQSIAVDLRRLSSGQGFVVVVVVVVFVVVVVGFVPVLICDVGEVVEEDFNTGDVIRVCVTGSLIVDRFVVGVLEGTSTDVETVVCCNFAHIGKGGSPKWRIYRL